MVRLDGYFAFVEHGAVEAEDVDEEIVDGLALVLVEVVALTRQVDVADVTLGIVEAIDALQIGELETGNTGGPVAIVRDYQHRLGGHDGSELRFARAATSELYGFAAFTGAAAVEMRSQVHHRGRGCDAVVEQG